jgi:hypothetical protein
MGNLALFCLGNSRAPVGSAFGRSSRDGGACIVIVIVNKIRNLQAATTDGRCYGNRLSFEEGFQLFFVEILQNACNVVCTLPGPSDFIEVLHDDF